MQYHPEDDEPTRPHALGVGLAIAAALIGGALIVLSGLGLALIVVINTI